MAETEKLDLSNIDWKSSKEFFQSLADELHDFFMKFGNTLEYSGKSCKFAGLKNRNIKF